MNFRSSAPNKLASELNDLKSRLARTRSLVGAAERATARAEKERMRLASKLATLKLRLEKISAVAKRT